MIRLTRINLTAIILNSDLIEHIEMVPDTMIALTNGQRLFVRETVDEIIERIIAFRRAVMRGAICGTAGGGCHATDDGESGGI